MERGPTVLAKCLFATNSTLDVIDRTEFFRQLVNPLYEALELPLVEQGFIDGTIHSFLFGTRLIGTAAFSGHRGVRTKEWLSRSDSSCYYIQLLKYGSLVGSVSDKQLAVFPGDIYIAGVTGTCDVICEPGMTVTLLLEKEELEYACGRTNLDGTVIRASTPLGKLLGRMLLSFHEEAGHLSSLEGDRIGEALVELLASIVKFGAANSSATPSQHLRMQISNFISENIKNPKLNVEYILECFRISRSHLYRVLEEVGGAASTIRQKRLQLAYRELGQRSGGDRVRIKEIANKYGFISAEQFSNSFKKQFSFAPTDLINRHDEIEPIYGKIAGVQRHFEKFSNA